MIKFSPRKNLSTLINEMLELIDNIKVKKMEIYTLTRLVYEKEQTLGFLFKGLKKIACTLELEWDNNRARVSCIPLGKYIVERRTSEKFGNHFHITNVVDRSYILIHHGNYHRDILGCILVGSNHTDIDGDGYRDVTSSKNTMKKLLETMPIKFELNII